MSPPSEHHGTMLASATGDKNDVACSTCGYCCHVVQGSHNSVQPLLESLRSNLQEFIESRIEKMIHPLRAEASTIKLWLALVANHLERVEPTCEDPQVGLFGPCSPVWRYPTPPFFTTTPARDDFTMTTRAPDGQKLYEATKMDVMPATKSTVVEDLIKLDTTMPLQSTEVKEHHEPSMVHMLSQVVTSAEEDFDVATARRSITKDPGLTITSETVRATTPLATITTSCE
ncbi:unnamed protein product [Urochloa humidicola]